MLNMNRQVNISSLIYLALSDSFGVCVCKLRAYGAHVRLHTSSAYLGTHQQIVDRLDV